MIYQQISIKNVIFKIINDLGIGDKEVDWQDWVEWISDGLLHIGSYYQFTEKETELEVEDFKTALPCDFYKLLRITANNYKMYQNEQLIADKSRTLDSLRFNTVSSGRSSDFNINHNLITVSFKTGKVNIQYLAIPTDCDGLPMVPDDVSFRDALFWKVAYHLSIRGYEFKNPQLRDINFTGQKWSKYCRQARAEANMPDIDMMEQLKNQWIKMLPNPNMEFNFYRNLGTPEINNYKGNK